jgi:hypothetical protein
MSKSIALTGTSYRSFGVHVKLVITGVCTVELILILFFVLASKFSLYGCCTALNKPSAVHLFRARLSTDVVPSGEFNDSNCLN